MTSKILLAVALLLSHPHVSDAADPPVITTIAGSPGEGPAKTIGQQPYDLAVTEDAVFAPDFTWNVVRKLDLTTGHMSIVGGNGGRATTGDGGPALGAQIQLPFGVERDAGGNLYVSSGTRVRKIDAATGTITSVAGQGTALPFGNGPGFGPAGLEFDDAGNLYVAEWLDKRVYRIDASFSQITHIAGNGSFGYGGDGGPATEAKLAGPRDIEVDDAGRVYIADRENARVRMVDTDGTITTIAGTGVGGYSGDGGPATAAQLWGPQSLALAGDGSLYVAEGLNRRIRRVAPDGTISTVAGVPISHPLPKGDGGPATQAFVAPEAIEFGPDGTLYVADSAWNGIRTISPGGIIDTISGNTTYGNSGDDGPAIQAQVYQPEGSVSFDAAGRMLIPETIYSVLREVDTDGTIRRTAGNAVRGYDGDNKPATHAMLYHPMDAVRAPDGSVYVSDNFGHRIRRIDPTGTITTVAGDGTSGFAGDGGPAALARLSSPCGLAVDAAGNLYVADSGNHRIRKLDLQAGTISTVAGIGVAAALPDGLPALVSPLSSPQGISFDEAGRLFIADRNSARIRMVDTDGFMRTVAGNGTFGNSGDGGPAVAAQLRGPTDVAVGSDGTVYIADPPANRIRAVGPDGVIRAFAGSGTDGFLGDGGPAVSARLSLPTGVAVGPDGAVYIVDRMNSRIRRVA